MVPRPTRPALIINQRSGGGKAERYDLATQCWTRGIEPIVFQPGDDLAALATAAVADGADALGMAGGDGSQAAVAAVAIAHDLPFVCVPAGTRNHFAFDIGVDRRDVVGALDAFAAGEERRIDVARVNGRVFLNNAALGLYAAIVDSPEYREHKVQTAIATMAARLGPDVAQFDLRFTDPAGRRHDGADLVVVSNNRYAPAPRPGRGTRGEVDAGVLGVIAVTGPPPRGITEWTAPTLRVESATTVALGIDGESVHLEPPLDFESVPLALRIRTRARSVGRPRLAP
ncbi:MAG TPA: diacylglycerol kinase family protein [Acidimicrobiia bacterium]|nr:diacylglycerol kinase family protein [Acidimicrobiia bacterium]